MPHRPPLNTRAWPPLKRAKDPAGGIKFLTYSKGLCTASQISMASDYASKSKLLVLAVLLCRYYRAISRALFGGLLLGNMSLAVLLIKLLNFLPLSTLTKQVHRGSRRASGLLG